MLYKVHAQTPKKRIIKQVAEGMRNGKVYIIPTDTVYAFATSLHDKKAMEHMLSLKELSSRKPLALYCRDFAQASEFIRMDNKQVFRWMKANLPGPYTLVFPASKKLPQYTLTKQKTVGIRIIDHAVVQALQDELDCPLIGTSVPQADGGLIYPEDLENHYKKQVGGILDTGPIEWEPSTIFDAREFPFEVLREGKGTV